MTINNLPKISIVTPTLNQAQYIGDCIESVLSQDYPNLEYFNIDGGSIDDTKKIVRNCKDKLVFISEKDDGQVDGINKGLRMRSGEIVAYLNSDNTCLPGCLVRIGNFFLQNPAAMIVTGKCKRIDESGREINRFITTYRNFGLKTASYHSLLLQNYISQPSTFWRRRLLSDFGYFNPTYRYAMDYEYWLRINKQIKIYYIYEYLAAFRIHNESITGKTSYKHLEEETKIAQSLAPKSIYLLHAILCKISATIFSVFYKRGNG